MHRIRVEEGLLSVTLQPRWGGGVVDAELTSHYACPKCGETLRFMALFDSSRDCRAAIESLELGYTVKVEAVDRFIVLTTGEKVHGRRASYSYYSPGSVCELVPFGGTQLELARTIWVRFQRPYGEIDWSKTTPMPRVAGRLDVTRLDKIEWVEDQMNSDNKSMLVVDSTYLRNPTEMIIGRWDTKEDYKAWGERRGRAPEIFLRQIVIPRDNY